MNHLVKPEIFEEIFQRATPFEYLDMILSPPPSEKLNITSVDIEIKKDLVEINSTVFKWSKAVPKEKRAEIDLDELEDPLELYGKWVTITKKRMMWVLSGSLGVEGLRDGDVYHIGGIRGVADAGKLIIKNTNFRRKKEIPVIKVGEIDGYYFATTFKYEPRESEFSKFISKSI